MTCKSVYPTRILCHDQDLITPNYLAEDMVPVLHMHFQPVCLKLTSLSALTKFAPCLYLN